jgi:NADH dehydrogenase FAD-containing subunit
MGKHLVLIGGGHAHLMTLAGLETFIAKGHRVTVIGPSEYHYYSGMGPGMLGNRYTPEEIRFATRRVVEKKGGTFLRDMVRRIEPENRTIHLESGGTFTYDVLSINAGSHVPKDLIAEDRGNVYPVKPIEKLAEARDRIVALAREKTIDIAVVGGGPAAVEIAGNVWRLARDSRVHPPRILVFAGRSLMPHFPERIRRMVRESLIRREIVIHEGEYVSSVRTGRVNMALGQSRQADFIFLAHGVRPSPLFKDSGLPTGPDGGLCVNKFLQCTEYADIFGGGDCIHFEKMPLDKVGVYAVRQNPVLFHNLLAAMEGVPLKAFDPQKKYMTILNMGDDTGILKKGWLEFSGRTAFRIKDHIDRKFMRRFQQIE